MKVQRAICCHWHLHWHGCRCHVLKFYVKVFHVMGRALSVKLSCMGKGLARIALSRHEHGFFQSKINRNYFWTIITHQHILLSFVLIFQLLHIDPEKRLTSLAGMKQHKYLQDMDFSKVLQRQISPAFVPSVRYFIFIATVK